MVKAVDEICASCGKTQPKKGSLTQWIGLSDSCRCAILDAQRTSGGKSAAQESQDAICQKCGRHLKRSTGSLTQWVFRQDSCNCDEAKNQAAQATEATANANSSNFSDSSGQSNPSLEETVFDGTAKTAGQIVARHYEVISCLGEGGTSVVYKARHQFMERIAAVKVLSPDRIPDAKTVQRFQQEARSVSRLKHPNIVDVHEFGVDENKQPFLIMDYLEGRNLYEAIEQDGPLKPSRAAVLFLQMADALKHAHEKGVIHRDLKPNNAILIKDENGHEQVKLVDFGIAKLSEPEDKEKALTQTGEIFGSPFYMSPEQCRGQKLDHRSDIYSFGCLMYEMITGEPAAKSGSVVETLMLHINGLTLDFDSQTAVRSCAECAKNSDSFEANHEQKCMNRLRQIIQACIQKEPADRYQSMEAIRRDLERLLSGFKPSGAKDGTLEIAGFGNSFGAERKTGLGKTLSEIMPVMIVVAGGIIAFAAAMLVYDPLQIMHKPKQEKIVIPMPKTANHLMVAILANGNTDHIDSLSADSVKNLEKDEVVTIRMRNTQVSDQDIGLLAQVSTLDTIDITGSSGFKQESLSELAKLPKLKTLTLAGTDVSDKSSLILQKLPIEKLDLSYTRFTDRGIENLMSNRSLKFIKPYKSLVTDQVEKILQKHGWKQALRDWWER
ncbi:MAG: protein kinase [Candidatus Obscuribacterales bacterium]|nr:protein kinase [Candidatus Obscuribacterales bacterium]